MLFKTLLFIHVITGMLGLITGSINMVTTKGNNFHKVVGNSFVYSMLLAGVSAFIMAILHTNYFLLMVGVFTMYMTVSGKRYIARKSFNTFDYTLAFSMFLAAVAFAALGFMLLLKNNLFGIVMIVFAFISFSFLYNDYKNLQLKIYRSTAIHLQRIIGAYIASFTAFLVVNAKYLPQFIPGYVYWLLPTVIFTPIIIWFSRKYTAP